MSKGSYSKGGLVALCSLVYFASYFTRKDFAAVMAAMLADHVMEKNMAGLVGTALFICYGVGQLISGVLGDRMKPQHLMLMGLVTSAACNLLMPLVPSPAWMIPIWALNGLAQAMLWPPIVRILADNLSHEDYVRANLVVTMAAHISTILLYVYVPLCLKVFSWQTVFYSAAGLAALTCLVLVVAMCCILPRESATPAPKKGKAAKEPRGTPYLSLLTGAGVLFLMGCIVMMGFLRDGIESWLPTLYSEAFLRDASESILISAVLPIFSIISITVAAAAHRGIFKNEAFGTAVLFFASIAVSVPLCLLIGTESAVLRVVCLLLASLICGCMHACNFLLISCLPGRFARFGRAATTSGFCNACTYVGAAASMYGIALVAEHCGWRVTVLTWIGIAAIGALLALVALRRYRRFIKESEA